VAAIRAEVTTFVIQDPRKTGPEGPIVFDCKVCDQAVLALDSDSHAGRVHRSSGIRVFNSESGYLTWVAEEEERAKRKASRSA
jgi:hypothetical protein